METIKTVIEYLIGVQLHPMVTAVVLVVIAIGRQRWECVHSDAASRYWMEAAKCTEPASTSHLSQAKEEERLADKAAKAVLLVGLLVSLFGQFALYWPTNGQSIAICAFMAFGQVGVASFVYSYAEKWGIMDRIGKVIQRKFDDKTK